MPENFEEYWKVVRPHRPPAREKSKPQASFGSPQANPCLEGAAWDTPQGYPSDIRALGEAVEYMQRYSQRLNDTNTLDQPRSELGEEASNTDIERSFQETVSEMIRRGIRIEPGFADRLRDDIRQGIFETTRFYPETPSTQVTADTVSTRQPLLSDPDFRAALQTFEEESVLGPLVRVEDEQADQSESQGITYAELEVQFQAYLEEMRAYGTHIEADLRELRSLFLWDFMESTRSQPTGDPGLFEDPFSRMQFYRDNVEGSLPVSVGNEMSPEEAARMSAQVEGNAAWYHSQGIPISLSELEHSYLENGGLRMDFTPERAEEEALQRVVSVRGEGIGNVRARHPDFATRARVDEAIETFRANLQGGSRETQDEAIERFQANLQGNPQRLNVPPNARETQQVRSGPNYARLGRQSEILLNIVNLFNELGVSCTVLNHQTNVELQLSLFASPEAPNSLGAYLSYDGVAHLHLGFPSR